MYGSEIVPNDELQGFCMENFQRFGRLNVQSMAKCHTIISYHAYQTECEFNKKRFTNILTEYTAGTSRRHRRISEKLNRYKHLTATA